ncbi:hypothetical protein L195_g046397, partial [Trifolium pratense]
MVRDNNEAMVEDINRRLTSGVDGRTSNEGENIQVEGIRIEGSLDQPNMGQKHYTRPPDVINGSLQSRPILQRIYEDNEPESNSIGINRDITYATMEIVDETPVSAQGAANNSFYRNCKQYIDIHHPEIFVIMELRTHPLKIKNSIEMMGFDGFLFSENRGFSGGIVIAWKKSVADINCIHSDFQFLHTRLVINGRQQFLFTAIYASPVEENRQDMWAKITNIANTVQESWLLAGDFNDIMNQEEKQGGALVNIRRCKVFQERVNDCKLLDLGTVGSKFTWRGPIYEDGVRVF